MTGRGITDLFERRSAVARITWSGPIRSSQSERRHQQMHAGNRV